MLPDARRRGPGGPRGTPKVDWAGHHCGGRHLVGYIHQRPRPVEGRVSQQLVRRVHRGPEEVGLFGKYLDPLVQRPGGEDPVQHADQVRGVGSPLPGPGEPFVVQPFGMADHPGQRRPVALAFQADDPEPSTAARRVVVHGGVAHRSSLPGLQGCAPHEEQVQVEADGVGPLAD